MGPVPMQDNHGFIVRVSDLQVIVFVALPKYSMLSKRHGGGTYLLTERSDGNWADQPITCLGLGCVIGSSTAGEADGRTAPRRTQGSSF